ncbi:MAG TPA: glycosyltransferase [Thermoanaerobaculia bacterium]|nr:glycosyltransferase [Thermoanaerobaculia bacterium]
MQRVLRVIARLNVGGPARHVVWLEEALAREGFATMLVTGVVPPGEDDMSAFAAERGVVPVVIPSMSRELSPRDLVTIWKLWRVMVRFRPDIVHTHTAKAGAAGRIAGLLYRFLSRRRCRFVHTYHGHVFHSYYGRWKTRVFLAIERFLARVNTDRIVVLGEQQRREICETFRVGEAKQFAIVPLGFDLDAVRGDAEQRDALRAELGVGADERIVGIIGRIAAIKNHDLFLRVAAKAHDIARFVIFGDGAERARLERDAAGRVIFAGTRDAAAIHAAVDVVALTSRNEGTPLAILEAMANGKPVISTDVGGVSDLLGNIVEHGDGFAIRERGVTVASDDEVGFVAALTRLLRDAPLREVLSKNGRAFVESAHTKERMAADIIRLYRELT